MMANDIRGWLGPKFSWHVSYGWEKTRKKFNQENWPDRGSNPGSLCERQRQILGRNEQKTTGSIWYVDIKKDGTCKMDRQNKKCSWAIKRRIKKNNAETDKKEEKKLAGPLVKKELPAEGRSRRNGKRRQEKISDDRQYYGKWTIRRYERKAEKRVEWKMLSLQWKTCPWAEQYDIYTVYIQGVKNSVYKLWGFVEETKRNPSVMWQISDRFSVSSLKGLTQDGFTEVVENVVRLHYSTAGICV